MTIRYECPECSSVLKIKVEKAGEQGKCPKCKSEFTIPEAPKKNAPAVTEDDLVDMPLEVTPVAVIPEQSISPSDEFDPLGVLNSDSAPGVAGSAMAGKELKPSVAELMKDHREKRSRTEARRIKRQNRNLNPLLADVETSGSAADAITRSYDKKREESSDAPRLSRDERRAAANRAGMIRLYVQLAGVLLVATVFGYGLFSYVLSGEGTDLVEVTGRVTSGGEPTMLGYRIRFTPIQERGAPKLTGGPSAARINSKGEFRLLYNAQTAGAIVAKHAITIEDEFGLPQSLPEPFRQREVTADGDNFFEFNF